MPESLQGALTVLLAILGLVVSIVVARAQYLQSSRSAYRAEITDLKEEIASCKQMGMEYERRLRECQERDADIARENDRLRAELGIALSALYRAGLLPERRGRPTSTGEGE